MRGGCSTSSVFESFFQNSIGLPLAVVYPNDANLWVNKNLQELSASVEAGMNSFAEVEASSVTHAFSKTVVSAYSGAYSEICVKAVSTYLEKWCQTH